MVRITFHTRIHSILFPILSYKKWLTQNHPFAITSHGRQPIWPCSPCPDEIIRYATLLPLIHTERVHGLYHLSLSFSISLSPPLPLTRARKQTSKQFCYVLVVYYKYQLMWSCIWITSYHKIRFQQCRCNGGARLAGIWALSGGTGLRSARVRREWRRLRPSPKGILWLMKK